MQQLRKAAFPARFAGNQKSGGATTAAVTLTLVMTNAMLFPCSAVAGDIGSGEQIFTNNCSGCHIGGANLVNEKRDLTKEALLEYGIGLDPSSIQKFLKNSLQHKKLVFFRAEGGKLTEDQWDDAATYISNQAINAKW